MRKGEQTRATILSAACELAAREGLEGLTIGMLAERTGMSKSGVFAHFGSREDLQIAVLEAYEQRFVEEVLKPGLEAPRGLARLKAILTHWVERTAVDAASSCIWIAGAAEFDDRPGPVRDVLVGMVRSWQNELTRAIQQAIETGELAADTDPLDLVFDLYGVMLVLHHETRLMNSVDALPRAHRALERLMKHCGATPLQHAPLSAPSSPSRTGTAARRMS